MYKTKKACDELSRGFVLIYPGGNILSVDADCEKAIPKKQAVLAIDMCEHAYFLDYGFDRSAYVGQLLKFLDLSRI